MLLAASLRLAHANRRIERGADRVDRSIQRVATSRVQLSDSGRMLRGGRAVSP